MQKYGGDKWKKGTKCCLKVRDWKKKHYSWQTHIVCVFALDLVVLSPIESKVADFMTSLSFKKSNEYIWAGGLFELPTVFCSFSECEQLVSFFVSSCFHGLQAHIGLSHSNCCFSPQVGKSRSPPYGVSRGIIRLSSLVMKSSRSSG